MFNVQLWNLVASLVYDMRENFNITARSPVKLCLLKVTKFHACIRPLFANQVTSNTVVITPAASMRLYLICKCNAWGRSAYKSGIDRMDVLQLIYFMVRERITGALSLCLAWITILYYWSCAAKWCGWFSLWVSLGFHVVKPEWIYHANSWNLPCIWTLYKHTYLWC